ncbi:MAG: hypothetical protein ACREJB_10485 [Planctomycetaceae bacterium]
MRYKDFVPQMRSAGGLFQQAEFDSFDAAAEAAGNWITNKGVRLLHIETVVLPNIHNPYEQGSSDPALRTRGDFLSNWHQFVRVWYEEP